MPLTAGTKLGHYEILTLIGAGGMGEVYRARDSRLGREVAVKILPPSFAADAERLRRFEQEARAVAALSHPNILALHDVGQHESSPFLVSELLDGESLREVLARGPLSQRKAVDYAIQIAQGLGAAHSKNIAHRDLKPDNVFITRDGLVKILDFGLAKNVLTGASDSRTASLTQMGPATDAGTVVGTASYMSPEQVRGGAVDVRTDIFSFGAVLYEMLSGKRAFKRDTTAETMTAILRDDPPELMESGLQIPPALDRIVRHCLEKAPEQRFQSARDLAFDLESLTTLTTSGRVSATKAAKPRRWWYAAAGAALLAIAAFAGWKIFSPRRASSAQFRQVTYRRGALSNARFTPDDSNIVYTAAWEASPPELYVVAADAAGGRPLDIKNAALLSVSGSGEFAIKLAPSEVSILLNPGNLARTSNNGGAPKAEIENVQTADFAPNGSGLAIVRYLPDQRICQLEYPVGTVLFRDQAINDLRFSPNGKYLAFITHADATDDRGIVVILRTNGQKVANSRLYDSAQGLAWTPSGQEVWSSSPFGSGQIHALSLSGKMREPLTAPGRLFLRDIASDGRLLVEQGIVRRGIIVSSDNGRVQRDLSWLDFGYLRDISHDGKTILFEEEGGFEPTYRVYLRNIDGSAAVPIGEGYGLTISSDLKWVLSQRLTQPAYEIWLIPVGPGEPRRLSPPNLSPVTAASFLSDNKRILFVAHESDRPSRTWLQSIDGTQPRPITPEGVIGWLASPDDKWLLAGRRPFVNTIAGPVLVSIDTGTLKDIRGIKPDDVALGWTSKGEIYVSSLPARYAMHIEKLNPFTGARTPWRDLAMPPIGGVTPDAPIITADGSSFAFDYRLRLSDLYTVSGVR